MTAGCCGQAPEFDGLSPAYRRALSAVIVINATMFLVEMGAGLASGSQALQADALDFLADTATYGLSLYVIGKPIRWRAAAAMLKGVSLSAMGLWVLASTAYHILVLDLPRAEIMGAVAFAALAANLLSVFLLLRYRNGDSNVRSVWLCSRNDAIGNIAVLGAAAAVWSTGSAWPDLVVAALIASLFLHASIRIIRQARAEMERRDTMQAA